MIKLEFSAKTNTSEEWKAIISAISTLVEEATFEATVEGISFRGMDPSHVALIDISWPNSAFEKYSCDGLWWMILSRTDWTMKELMKTSSMGRC